MIKLKKGESVVTAFPTHEAGPGWANRPIWLIVRGADHVLREECLQPSEQTGEMALLFEICREAHTQMRNAVIAAISNGRKR